MILGALVTIEVVVWVCFMLDIKLHSGPWDGVRVPDFLPEEIP